MSLSHESKDGYRITEESILSPEEFKLAFDQRLHTHCEDWIAKAHELDPEYGRLIEYTADMMLHGGKRIRPYLVYAGYKGFGGQHEEGIMDVCIAMETYHAALVTHDDVMDGDDTRHGTKNVVGHYKETLPARVSEAMGILSGDWLIGNAFETIVSSDKLTPEEMKMVLQEITRLNDGVSAGQQLDMLLNVSTLDDVDINNVRKMYIYKTALYTFDIPLRLGARMAGASEDDLINLSQFATDAGIAFQITDDDIGIFGDERKTGKPIGSDIREGKKTLLMVTAYQDADNATRSYLAQMVGKPDVTPEQIDAVRQILHEGGARKRAKEAVFGLLENAQEHLSHTSLADDIKSQLSKMIAVIPERLV